MSCWTLRSRISCCEGLTAGGVGAGRAGAVAWGEASTGDFAGCEGPQPASRRASTRQPEQQFRKRLISVHAADCTNGKKAQRCKERPCADDKLCHGRSPRAKAPNHGIPQGFAGSAGLNAVGKRLPARKI